MINCAWCGKDITFDMYHSCNVPSIESQKFHKPNIPLSEIDKVFKIVEGVGKKYDSDKVRMDLLPFDSLEDIAKVLTFGAKKYGENNWKLLENPIERYEAAMLRHITSYKNGELLDQETGLPHLAHAGCCLLFLISFKHGLLKK